MKSFRSICVFNQKDTNVEVKKARGCPGVPKDTAAPLLNVPSLRVTLRMGKWTGMDFYGVQVGREVTADDVANDSRSEEGANQSDSNICHCDNLIPLAYVLI